MRTASSWIALTIAAGIPCAWVMADAQEPKPASGPESKSFSNGQLSLVIREAQRGGRSEFWVLHVRLKMPSGWQTILEGVDGGEFSTSLGGANATGCEVIKNDATGLTVRLSCKQDTWEAEEVIDLPASSTVLQRRQTYRFLKAIEGAIHPGFRLKAESDIRYTFPLRIHEQTLAGLKPVRRAVEWAVPLPFHVWHNPRYVALYGLDKSGSAGTLDFTPVGPDGCARLRVYYPDSCPEKVLNMFWPPDVDTIPGTAKFAEGAELTLREIIAAKCLAAGDDPLLESERIAASILLPKLPHPAKPKAVADGVANYLKHCGLWEPNALGPGRGWFYAMWTGILKEPAARQGTFDLGWGMGYAVENWMGAVRHWRRTGNKDLLPYVDEMTKNMEHFRRGSEVEVPYFDASDGNKFGDGHLAHSIWTYFYDLPVPKTYVGISRGGQCCCNHYPVIFVIGPALAMEPLLALSKITGDSFYERMAAEMASYIGNSQIRAPGKPWDGTMVHAILQYRGEMHRPDLGCHMDPGMSSGNSLAALEAWLAHHTQSDKPTLPAPAVPHSPLGSRRI